MSDEKKKKIELPDLNFEQEENFEQENFEETVGMKEKKEKLAEDREKNKASLERYRLPEAGKEQNGNDIVASGNIQRQHLQRQVEIEKILAEDLDNFYLGMNSEQQREFKIKGEETAKKINALLSTAKIKLRKIIVLIKKWLRLIPGVNSFFLEQEAKIKADEILKLSKS